MHPALFYRPGDRLTAVELGAARLDGHVIEVGEGYMPMDTVEGADARATSIAHLVPANTAACGPTAAWIHGAGDSPPMLHHVRRTSATRLRSVTVPRVVYHEGRAAPDSVQTIAGVHVTGVLPTAMELLFDAALAHTDAPWLRALLLVEPELLADVRVRLEATPRRPGRRGAVQLVDALVAAGGVRRS
ncbi:hypothetical protein QF046_000447 [Microbacterium sp. W4I4]|uniref:hypothetical protein n=1 Tax=Microbacterium sp. W4I4 TaxID=3042295 RepID=UPI00278A63F5|nr:hypothetical protein [Microbacterium sp. W4I4]MDQ0612806.1 hypothetical protein [Microbacterium sp. W4I4]